MKKLLAALCCALLCLSLAACGSSSSETPASKTETPAEKVESSSSAPQEGIYFDSLLGDIKPEAVEVVYNQVDMISYRHGFAYFIVFVEVKNVADEAIVFGPLNSYTLNKADGTVFEEDYFDWNSKLKVEPGETVYLYDYVTSDKVEPGEQVVCVPEVDDGWRSGDEDYFRFHEVSDLKVTNASEGPMLWAHQERDDGDHLLLSGTLHCGVVAEGKDVIMTCVGYDHSGKPVCMFTGYVEDAESYSDVEVVLSAEVYGSVTAEDLADDFQVCAYNTVPADWVDP